ncbi:unnamed protein product [Calypogeia fissa]
MINRWAEKESRVARPSPKETELKRKAISQSDISLPSKRQKVVAVERGVRDIVDRTEVVEKAHYPTTSNDTNDGSGEPLDTREDLEEANEFGRSDGTPSASHNISDAEESTSSGSGDALLDDLGSERFPSPSGNALIQKPVKEKTIKERIVQDHKQIQKPVKEKILKERINNDQKEIQKPVKEKTPKAKVAKEALVTDQSIVTTA